MDFIIRQVNNGYIVEYNGNTFIAKSLLEAASLAGEDVPTKTVYHSTCSAETLKDAKERFYHGDRIGAVKTVRNAFNPPLGLREAVNIVDTWKP